MVVCLLQIGSRAGRHRVPTGAVLLVNGLAVLLSGACVSGPQPASPSMDELWSERGSRRTHQSSDEKASPASDPGQPATVIRTEDAAIAIVSGRPISRQRVVDLLLRSHGPALLEQLVVLQQAERLATEKTLTVAQSDVDREYERSLRRFVTPLRALPSDSFDRDTAEALLDTVLADRNISREEYLLAIRRNAYLRKIVESVMVISDSQIRAAYERRYVPRIQVRDIQLATSGEVARVLDRLREGEDFAELASQYSIDSTGARNAGLLEPFSRQDEDVPAAFRKAAFALKVGETSAPQRIGPWYHLIRVEKMLPPETVDREKVRGELEQRVRDRLAEPAMQKLYERLFREANLKINDPVLRDAFASQLPGRAPKQSR